jgi:endonuclease-3
MRKETVAPVDTMGCGVISERTSPKIFRYQTLISLMLSSQTVHNSIQHFLILQKDQVTAAAMANLKTHGLTVSNILTTDEETVDSLINKVGFHRRKAK